MAPSIPRRILVISLNQYLHGKPVSNIIDQNWQRFPEQERHFSTVGFDFDANDIPAALTELETELGTQDWDGVMVGWCLRGNQARTVLFEQIAAVCTKAMRNSPRLKLMFCSGPDNIAEATMRNFPIDS